MLTLQDVGRVAEAQRRFPNWIIWAVILVAIAWAVGTAVRAFPWQAAGSPATQSGQEVQVGPAPAESNSAPAQNPQPEAVVPSAPREIEVPWVLLGTGKPVTETMNRLGIPWEKWVGVGGPEANERLNAPRQQTQGFGDGTAYFLHDLLSSAGVPWVENPDFYFTPDQGKTWFRVENPYPGQSITSPGMRGANIEGNNLVLFIELQPEPWVGAWWKAEIPLSQLEGQSP